MNNLKWFGVIHIITLFLLIISIIVLFFENLLFAIVPVLLYIIIHRKNSLLLFYIRTIKSEFENIEFIIDDMITNLFLGREIFILSMMNLLMAIVYNSVINLLAAIWLLYVSIIRCEYIKI